MEEIPQNQKDVSVAETKAEELKLEWGPELGEMSWSDAQSKITELNSKLTEGEKTWRLPTNDELIAEFKKTGSTPDGFQGDNFWSSTSGNTIVSTIYSVNMGNGEMRLDDQFRSGSLNLVRCVRSNKEKDVPIPDAESIESSKIEWGPELGEMSWNVAQEKIAELNSKLVEGEKPWRLPTKNELIDGVKKNTGSSQQNFPSATYWSSTADSDSPKAFAWWLNGGFSGMNYYDKKSQFSVRCVR
jgi:hypothetical protein